MDGAQDYRLGRIFGSRRQQHDWKLPDLVFKSGFQAEVSNNRVRIAQNVEASLRDRCSPKFHCVQRRLRFAERYHTVNIVAPVGQLRRGLLNIIEGRPSRNAQHVPVAACVALHPYRPYRQQHSILGFTQAGFHFGAETPDGKSGPWKRVPREKAVRYANLASDLAHFVFVERSERLDNAARFNQRLNAGHAIVMRLDQIRLGGSAGFDGVRINRALAQNPVAVQKVLRSENALLHADKLFADGRALLLRIDDAGKGRQELVFGMIYQEVLGAQLPKDAFDKIGLVLAHEAGIDVDSVNPLRSKSA